MRFQVIVKPTAEKAIESVPKEYRARTMRAIDALATDPYLGKPLHGKRAGQFSYRIGPYRIIYRIEKNLLIVFVIDFGGRGGVY